MPSSKYGYLASCVMLDDNGVAYPDTLVGTDSHTTTINCMGVLGWGVGGIEAEAAMLGQPIPILTPEVVGFKLTGSLGGCNCNRFSINSYKNVKRIRRCRKVCGVLW